MSSNHFLKLSLSMGLGFGLLACNVNHPELSSETPQASKISLQKPADPGPIKAQTQLTGKANYDAHSGQITLKIQPLYPNNLSTQSIQCNAIAAFEVLIHGPGLEPPLLPDEADNEGLISGSGCTGVNATFSSVPVGKNRVLWVHGLDNNNDQIPGSEVSVVLDIVNGSNSSVDLNQLSHVSGRVLERLFHSGQRGIYLFSRLNHSDLDSLIFDIVSPQGQPPTYDYYQTGSVHPAWVNVDKIAEDLIAKDGDLSLLSTTDANYRLSSGTLSGIISGGSGDYSIIYRDPSSLPIAWNGAASASFSIPKTTPGEWLLEVHDNILNKQIGQTVDFNSSSNNFDFSTLASVSDWNSLNGPYGGAIPAIMRLDANTILAGSLNGVFKSSDFSSTKTWQRKGLLHEEVISFSQPDLVTPGPIYAGTTNGLYQSTDSGDTWSKVDDASLNGKAVYDVVLFNGKLYAGVEDGVAEEGLPNWSMVNTGIGSDPVTDLAVIDNAGAYLVAAQPVSINNLYFSTIPGGGWNTFPAPPGTSPEHIEFANGKIYLTGATGRAFFTSNFLSDFPFASVPSWGLVGSTALSGSITDIAVVDYASPDFRFYAGSNGSALQYSDFNSVWSDWSDAANGPPPINNPFVTRIDASFAQSDFSGLIAATKGGGLSEIQASGAFAAVNTGLLGHHIKDIAVFEPAASGAVIFAATSGGGVLRYSFDNIPAGWEPLLNVPVPAGAPGLERYPQAIAVDDNGNLYAAHKNAIVMLPAAHTASANTAWVPVNDINPSGSFDSLTGEVEDLEVVGNKIYSAVSFNSAGDQGIYGRCTEGNSGCGFPEDTKWEHLLSNTSVFKIAHLPSTALTANPTVFAAGENTFLRSDNGTTFSSLTGISGFPTLTNFERITDLAVSETTDDIYVYGTLQKNPLMGSGQEGLLRYQDDKAGTEIIDFITNPLNGSTFFNAVEVAPEDPNQVFLAVAGSGLWRTDNGTGVSPSFSDFNHSSLALSPALNNLVVNTMTFLGPDLIAGSFGQGVVKSNNVIAP